MDLSKIDRSVRAIPYVPPSQTTTTTTTSPFKTREVFVYSSPKKSPPASPAKSKPALLNSPTIALGSDSDGDQEKVRWEIKAANHLQGVNWYWRSDTGWEKYSPAVNAKIEKAFLNKETKVDVDKQRWACLLPLSDQPRYITFVDMLQLRFDDIFKTRSRGIQRRVNGQVWSGKAAWLPTRTDSGRIVP